MRKCQGERHVTSETTIDIRGSRRLFSFRSQTGPGIRKGARPCSFTVVIDGRPRLLTDATNGPDVGDHAGFSAQRGISMSWYFGRLTMSR